MVDHPSLRRWLNIDTFCTQHDDDGYYQVTKYMEKHIKMCKRKLWIPFWTDVRVDAAAIRTSKTDKLHSLHARTNHSHYPYKLTDQVHILAGNPRSHSSCSRSDSNFILKWFPNGPEKVVHTRPKSQNFRAKQAVLSQVAVAISINKQGN